MGDTVQVREHVSAEVVARMVTSWRTGDADGVADGLIALRAAYADDDATAIRAAARAVLRGCAVMILTLAAVRGPGDAVRVRVFDPSGRQVDPEEGPPPLRTLFGALTATVEGDSVRAEEALDRVVAVVSPAERNVLLLTLLAWTASLVDACERHRLPRPRWLAGRDRPARRCVSPGPSRQRPTLGVVR
ncbi:hypothetical protein LX15_004433 [Streptoalloteichus tenebrarius]|uniref:Uncharacterized protein n=1 Tax=Streptoalloteichus tenebrarius (strain ATCC 17920 / DSM 40477 / JCM 4838 / CBS 697.72 / NBRC 16177 / NCIMB 11028 / NRRL B-12390 / A12253. 1 / ISP 5477) TaxID=1933 RepID=A0ABT1HYX5_STRSD|nr:hypothetical protein [Streptoalloteichus tenebrarius]MCP2260713.1 hypothetical protein [Streptoalloteichus tenebrarius]BFF03753.1 hypothetical protein GCM10020241_54280 [Streptoalloteichus tenebrarius]